MPITTGFRVSELLAGGLIAAPSDIAPTDVALFLDASDTGALHGGPGGTIKPLHVSDIPSLSGFGTAAVKNTGTAAGQIPVLDGSANLSLPPTSKVKLWDGAATITNGGARNVLEVPGTYTFGAGADLVGTRIIDLTATYVIDTPDVNVLFGEIRPFRNSLTLKSGPNNTNRNLQDLQGFRDSPLIQADTSDDTMFMVHSHVAAPSFNTTGGGTLLLDVLTGFLAAGSGQFGAGVTITDRYGLKIEDLASGGSNTGLLTNNYGIGIARLKRGTTKNVGILNNSETHLWNDGPTITTGGPTHVLRIGAASSWTLGAGSDGIGTRFIEIDPTINVDTTINLLFGEFRPFLNSITLKSAPGATARNLQDMQGFRDSPLIRADGSADTMFMVHSFVSVPSFDAINAGGSLLLDLYQGFYAVGRVMDGATITTRKGLQVDDYEKVGTGLVTNQYGVDIARFLNATAVNVGIRNNSPMKLWDDIVTFNTNPDDIISIPGTVTLGTGATVPPRTLHANSTLVVDTTLNAFAVRSIIVNDSIYKSASNATARDMKDMRSFVDGPTVKPDLSADTMANFASFASQPNFTRAVVGSGSLALANLVQLWALGPAINAGITVTDRRGVYVQDPTGAGLLTNNYGVDIVRMVKGTAKVVGLRSNSPVVLWDDTVTFTTLQDNVLSVLGTFTFSSGATFTTRALSVKDTLVINTTLDALSTPSVVQSDRVIKSFANATARDFKSPRTFSDTSTVQGDTSADTMAQFASFHSAPIFGILNSGQLAITEVNQLYAAASAVGQGVTVTTHRGLRVENPTLTGNGAVVTAIGLDVADITAGNSKNRAIRVGSGGIEIATQDTTSETTPTLPSGALVFRTKGNKLVIGMNVGGTMRWTSIDFSGNGNAFTTTSLAQP